MNLRLTICAIPFLAWGTACSKATTEPTRRETPAARPVTPPEAAPDPIAPAAPQPAARARPAAAARRPAKAAPQQWTCSMHPRVRTGVRGKCPICGMELIRASAPAKPPGPVWMCSMHPRILAGKAGKCPVCAMDLIRVQPTPRPRTLSPIPSRPKLAASATFRARLDAVYLAYLFIHRGLRQDQAASARRAAKRLLASLPGVVSRGESAQVKKAWATASKKLARLARQVAAASNLRTARNRFMLLSSVMIAAVQKLGLSGSLKAYRFHCPMANKNRGADWLQDTPAAENPYFGAAMLRCGSRRPL